MIRFCPDCLTETETAEVRSVKSYQLRGETIDQEIVYLQCSRCHGTIPDSRLEEENYLRLYNSYRLRNHLLQPAEIVSIRKQYGLSQRQLARLLGWSHATLSRYESGALQDSSHDYTLRMLQEPENMLLLLDNNRGKLTDGEMASLRSRIEEMLADREVNSLMSRIEKFFIKRPSRYTGFRAFDLDRFVQTVKFFASLDRKLFKVKLMKYLWYSDFLNFKRTTNSINGLVYMHLPLGPVPASYELLLSLVENRKDQVAKEYIDLGCENPGELYRAIGEFNNHLFSGDELETLSDVHAYFKNDTSSTLSARSHHEAAWLKTGNNDPISYEYALELSVS